ncbi:hypothetical protein SUGI_0499030 [Cryptomeria japonica]|nr:hypothetical protein SUGI_0499030 [Cryptomeria japonica]
MDGLVPYVYRAVVQQRSNRKMTQFSEKHLRDHKGYIDLQSDLGHDIDADDCEPGSHGILHTQTVSCFSFRENGKGGA